MKGRIFIFSSLLCLCGTFGAQASECVGAGCDTEPIVFEEFELVQNDEKPAAIVVAAPVAAQPTWLDSDPVAAQMPDLSIVNIPMRTADVKVLTIKPVPEDTRPKLWDGTVGKYAGHDGAKTIDQQNGIPIWDESINSYKYKDFSDWFLKDTPEIYLRDTDLAMVEQDPIALYNQNMEDAAATRARVEELLAPRKPSKNLWFADSDIETADYETTTIETAAIGTATPEQTALITESFVHSEIVFDDGCPFETETECEIWRRKPIVRESVSPRSAKLRDANMNEFLDAADCNIHITANEPVAAPLLERYKMLMRSAQACCTDGMAYELKQAGASNGLIYKFLADDANFYGLGARCLMMTDHELDTKYPNTATAVVAADVRNGCLCRSRQWFKAMLAPFEQAYSAMPEFKDAQFNYTYKDGLQREITVSVNNDVQNVLKQLAQCP